MKVFKFKCKVCGEVFEVKENEEKVCPLCRMKEEHLELLEEREV